MYIAIILENLTFARANEELTLEDQDFEDFYSRWEVFDPAATQFLHVDSLFAKYENLPIGEKKKRVGLAVPLGYMGDPTDVCGAAVFLASDEAAYITAQTLNVDGGSVMS